MSEEEETRAALVAAALCRWEGPGSVAGHYLWRSGHIDLRNSGKSLCGVDPYDPRFPSSRICPKCALLWYREMRDEG